MPGRLKNSSRYEFLYGLDNLSISLNVIETGQGRQQVRHGFGSVSGRNQGKGQVDRKVDCGAQAVA